MSNGSKKMYGLLIMLHTLLVLLYVGLIVIWARGLLARAGIFCSFLISVSQTFIVTYVACLLFITQYLSLNRVLLRPKNFTAVHDISTAWIGLGSALLTLRRQFSIPAAVPGTLSITIYSACLYLLHITTPSLYYTDYDLLEMMPLNLTVGMPQINHRDVFSDSDNITGWAAAIQLLPYLSIIGNQSTLGLANPTLYDILDRNFGVGNTTVNATTAEVECLSVPNATATLVNANANAYLWAINVIYDNYDINFTLRGILASGVVQRFTWYDQYPNTPLLLGRNAIFLTTFNVVDSQGNAGSYVSGYNYTNLQIIGCTLSWTPTKAVVHTSSRYILATESGRATGRSSEWSEWKPELQNITDNGENLQEDVWADIFKSSPISPLLGATLVPNVSRNIIHMNQTEEYIVTALGQPAGGNVTLTQFENVLSDLSSSVFWASIHALPSSKQGNYTSIIRGSTSVPLRPFPLKISPTSLFFSLVASVLLLVTAVFLTYGVTKASYMLDGMGPLQVIWLTAEHADMRKRIASVGEPTTSNLRKAGMLETINLDHSASDVTLVNMEYSRVDGKDNE